MSIYSKVESGTSFHRSRFTRSISNRMDYDCQFHQLVPVLKRFVLPGDIWKIGGDVLVRFQPMLSPTLTPNNFRVRYFFVPLRLLESDTELILTGSKDGKLYAPTEGHPDTPVFKNFIADATLVTQKIVSKHGFWDYMNVQPGDYSSIDSDECLPAQYWQKGYVRIFWDYYRDENLSFMNRADFDDLWENSARGIAAAFKCYYSMLSKDYFTSALPWQLKGTAPRIDVTGAGTWTPNFDVSPMFYVDTNVPDSHESPVYANTANNNNTFSVNGSPSQKANIVQGFNQVLNNPQSVAITNLGFTADDLRTMMAQTRVFERLARTGSRYTEYLRANFGTAPADDTLQRAQYLGGWKVPIVTTEVLQTAQDSSNPVGTMRGHGITRGGNRISTFYAKEFGLLFGIAEVRPDVQYTTGIPRQLTYKRRWDFFNPSFQHLSEQEVRNGELFISFTDGNNDKTFGFQAYANELRTYQNETVGELRGNLSYWNQALHFTSRPNLNEAFLLGSTHMASFNAPFAVNGAEAYPIIVQFYNNLDVYRPMVRYATPGLIDHL